MTVPVFSCCCDWGFEFIKATAQDDDTPWCERSTHKLMKQDGQFTSTIVTSQSVATVQSPWSISWDGTNTPWAGGGKLFLQSGQFTSTIKDSVDALTSTHGIADHGITWDGTNTPWTVIKGNTNTPKAFLQSGQFTTTVKTSQAYLTLNYLFRGTSWRDGNSVFIAETDPTPNPGAKGFRYSGQFTTTVQNSASFSKDLRDVSWDGNNSLFIETGATNKLHSYLGQFSTSLRTSETVTKSTSGINTNILTVG